MPEFPHADTGGLSPDDRALIADEMSSHWDGGIGEGANKCIDCCLHPECGACGEACEHDTQAEAAAAWEWMRMNARSPVTTND